MGRGDKLSNLLNHLFRLNIKTMFGDLYKIPTLLLPFDVAAHVPGNKEVSFDS